MSADARAQAGAPNAPHGGLACERRGPVGVLRLSRPEVLNAIDAQVCEALQAHLDLLERDPEIRVVLLEGEGERAFSAGADLRHMRGLEGPGLRRFIELTWRAFDRLHRSPLLTIAALHGHVLGGGLELALACDMRIADETASLALPEMGLGSVPGSGAMQRLPALIGESRTLDLALSGRRLDAAEALSLGLVNRVVGPGALREAAIRWAEACAARPPEAIRYAKTAMRARGDPDIAAALHGLISGCCQKDHAYQDRTQRFQT